MRVEGMRPGISILLSPSDRRRLEAIILDRNTPQKPKVRAWLERHPRWTFHFTPTSCSWLNAVETFFATLTKRTLKRGVFRSVVDLQATINRHLADANRSRSSGPRSRQDHRRRQALDSIH